jgi:hypothetical protein
MAIAALVWEALRRQARRRLHDVETGARCVACDGTDLERAGEAARCLRCGYVASLARIAAVRGQRKRRGQPRQAGRLVETESALSESRPLNEHA